MATHLKSENRGADADARTEGAQPDVVELRTGNELKNPRVRLDEAVDEPPAKMKPAEERDAARSELRGQYKVRS